jgi:hypothetical protein
MLTPGNDRVLIKSPSTIGFKILIFMVLLRVTRVRNPNVVLSLRFVFTSISFHSKDSVDRPRFVTWLTCDVLELFLDLLPVHHVPPIGNVFGSLVVVLEIIRVFPNIET